MTKKGMTSGQFIAKMEAPKGQFSDADIIGMTEEQFKELVRNSGRISNFTKKLKKRGFTEFSTAWGTRILIDANRRMAQSVQMLQALAGGISQKEAGELSAVQRARSKEDLRYIA